jgi:hypothetical protein
MSRARNIKPGFFKNDELGDCSIYARVLFIGLWCEADREGRLEDRPKRIKANILPYDDCDVDDLLNQLAERKFILRYQANGRNYIQVVNFTKHQQPHYKEVASEIPPPPGHADSGVVAFGVSEADRQRIFDRDGRACVECGATDRLSLDHIVPRSKGGTDDDDNLRTLCVRCNSSKSNRDARVNVGSTSGQRRDDGESTETLDDPLIPDSLNPDPLIADSRIPGKEKNGQARPKKPRSPSQSPPKPSADSLETDFEARFYGPYPRHVKRDDALKAWLKLSDGERDAAVDGLRRWLEGGAFSPDVSFVPYPASWLNGRRWSDDIAAVNPPKAAVAVNGFTLEDERAFRRANPLLRVVEP